MYKSKLNVKETQHAIHDLKHEFTHLLSKRLNLIRVSAPLFVKQATKINDGLNGETPVVFTPKHTKDIHEVVHSLAKWKRTALRDYEFKTYEGFYTDMNAIRREEDLDYKHSYYVDQWDWERIIKKEDRNLEFLKKTVESIYKCIVETKEFVNIKYPALHGKLPDKIEFFDSEEVYKMFPNLSAEEREEELIKKHKAIFIYKVGYNLPDGKPHSARAFDYDDWTINGDIILYDFANKKALEVSSMGIRVDKEALLKQKQYLNIPDSKMGEYHQDILDEKLPFTIGGGIGQSRLSMFLLEKKHIGEVQVSSWDQKNIEYAKKEGIKLL